MGVASSSPAACGFLISNLSFDGLYRLFQKGSRLPFSLSEITSRFLRLLRVVIYLRASTESIADAGHVWPIVHGCGALVPQKCGSPFAKRGCQGIFDPCLKRHHLWDLISLLNLLRVELSEIVNTISKPLNAASLLIGSENRRFRFLRSTGHTDHLRLSDKGYYHTLHAQGRLHARAATPVAP